MGESGGAPFLGWLTLVLRLVELLLDSGLARLGAQLSALRGVEGHVEVFTGVSGPRKDSGGVEHATLGKKKRDHIANRCLALGNAWHCVMLLTDWSARAPAVPEYASCQLSPDEWHRMLPRWRVSRV